MLEQVKEADLNYVTNGTIDANLFRALVDVTLRKSALIKFLAVVYVFYLICGIWGIVQHSATVVLCCVGFWILFTILLLWKRNHSIKLSLRRMREVYGAESVGYRTGFTDELICGENKLLEGKNVAVTYADLKRIYDTRQYIFLITKGSQCIAVFKNELTEDECKTLLAFLKEKKKSAKK
jgi:hypothetical protein